MNTYIYIYLSIYIKQLVILLHVIVLNIFFRIRASYFQIMEWTNTTSVRCSEFHVDGYPTIFSRICFTNGKLQCNCFLQYIWRQSFVSYLENLYFFWCLHFDINSGFLFSKLFPPHLAISNFSFKNKKHLFESVLQEEHFQTISHVITGVCPDFFIRHTLLDN